MSSASFSSAMVLGALPSSPIRQSGRPLLSLAVADAPTGMLPPWNDMTSNIRVTSEVSLTRTV